MLAAMAMGLSNATAGRRKPEPPATLTAAGEKLLAQYSGMLTALQAEIVKSVPKIDEKLSAAFLKAYAREAAAKAARDAAMSAAQRAGRSKDAKDKANKGKALKDADETIAYLSPSQESRIGERKPKA